MSLVLKKTLCDWRHLFHKHSCAGAHSALLVAIYCMVGRLYKADLTGGSGPLGTSLEALQPGPAICLLSASWLLTQSNSMPCSWHSAFHIMMWTFWDVRQNKRYTPELLLRRCLVTVMRTVAKTITLGCIPEFSVFWLSPAYFLVFLLWLFL